MSSAFELFHSSGKRQPGKQQFSHVVERACRQTGSSRAHGGEKRMFCSRLWSCIRSQRPGRGPVTPYAPPTAPPAHDRGSWLGVLPERSLGFRVNRLHAFPPTRRSFAAHEATHSDSVRGHDVRLPKEHYRVLRSAIHSDAHIQTRPSVHQTG